MTANTGRTAGKYVYFQIETSTGAMACIPVNSFGSVGLTFAEQDVSALQDAVTSILNGQGSFSTTISGPFDTKAVTAVASSGAAYALSGSHTVLSALNGANTARSFAIGVGIQHYYTTGEPVFGAIDSVLVSQYTTDGTTYTARISTAGNRINDPAWGTSSVTASS